MTLTSLLRLPTNSCLAFSEHLLSMKYLAFHYSHGIIENIGDNQYRLHA